MNTYQFEGMIILKIKTCQYHSLTEKFGSMMYSLKGELVYVYVCL